MEIFPKGLFVVTFHISGVTILYCNPLGSLVLLVYRTQVIVATRNVLVVSRFGDGTGGILPNKPQSFHNWTKTVFEAEWISGCCQLIGPELPAQEIVKPSMTDTMWSYGPMNVLTCSHNLPQHLCCSGDTISL